MAMKEKTGILGAAGFVVFMASLLWIGLDLFLAQRQRQQVAQDVQEALRLQDAEHSVAALDRLMIAQDRWIAVRGRPAFFFLEKLQPSAFDFAEIGAAIHRGAGMRFSGIQVAAEAEKQYVLALVSDPELEDVPGDLLMECFYTRNLELGWIASRMVVEKRPQAAASRLILFFEENYQGPRPGD
jgi:hypothetical protein